MLHGRHPDLDGDAGDRRRHRAVEVPADHLVDRMPDGAIGEHGLQTVESDETGPSIQPTPVANGGWWRASSVDTVVRLDRGPIAATALARRRTAPPGSPGIVESSPTIRTPPTTVTQLAWIASIHGVSGKRRPQEIAIVVVAGQRQERHRQAARSVRRADLVLLRPGPVRQVAGADAHVDAGYLGVESTQRPIARRALLSTNNSSAAPSSEPGSTTWVSVSCPIKTTRVSRSRRNPAMRGVIGSGQPERPKVAATAAPSRYSSSRTMWSSATWTTRHAGRSAERPSANSTCSTCCCDESAVDDRPPNLPILPRRRVLHEPSEHRPDCRPCGCST